MKRGILVIGVVCAVLGLAYLILSFKLDMGTREEPGTGLYPVMVGATWMVCALGSIVFTLVRPPEGAIQWPTGAGRIRTIAIVVASLFYVFAVETVGYIICSAVVMLVCLHVMGMRSWLLKIGIVILVVLSSYVLFDIVLRVPLPRGLLQFY